MKVEDIKIVKTSRKGAALVEFQGKQAWIRPMQATKLAEGKITKGIKDALENGKTVEKMQEEFADKKCYRIVKPREIVQTEKAVLFKCFDGSKGWAPKICVEQKDGDSFYVQDWVVRKNGLQASADRIYR